MNDYSITIFMRTEAMDGILDKWVEGEPKYLGYGGNKETVNEITSQIEFDEPKYYPEKLVKILKQENEPFYILADYYEDESDIHFEVFYSPSFRKELGVEIRVFPHLEVEEYEEC